MVLGKKNPQILLTLGQLVVWNLSFFVTEWRWKNMLNVLMCWACKLEILNDSPFSLQWLTVDFNGSFSKEASDIYVTELFGARHKEPIWPPGQTTLDVAMNIEMTVNFYHTLTEACCRVRYSSVTRCWDKNSQNCS